jgi:hypothetical protein
MTYVSVRLTLADVELLSQMVAEQLFRREFFDAWPSEHPADPAELARGKKLLERLRRARERAKRGGPPDGHPDYN